MLSHVVICKVTSFPTTYVYVQCTDTKRNEACKISRNAFGVGGPFERFVDWWQCAADMQRKAWLLCQVVVMGVM